MKYKIKGGNITDAEFNLIKLVINAYYIYYLIKNKKIIDKNSIIKYILLIFLSDNIIFSDPDIIIKIFLNEAFYSLLISEHYENIKLKLAYASIVRNESIEKFELNFSIPQTLAGIMKDNNPIRDSIEKFLNEAFDFIIDAMNKINHDDDDIFIRSVFTTPIIKYEREREKIYYIQTQYIIEKHQGKSNNRTLYDILCINKEQPELTEIIDQYRKITSIIHPDYYSSERINQDLRRKIHHEFRLVRYTYKFLKLYYEEYNNYMRIITERRLKHVDISTLLYFPELLYI